ncbi:hypothetical protein [Bacillus sp. 2205SS5-2]|uniref:hypothetical protein n=1 Tax=Bacillus sp. 2205SS5-2 TaxID=3109031 RepID=UPI003003BD22
MKRKVCLSLSLFSFLFGVSWFGHESLQDKRRYNNIEKEGIIPLSTYQEAEPVSEPVPFGSREYIRYVQ